VVDRAVFFLCGFEEGDLVGPGGYIDFEKGNGGVLRFGEGIEVAGEDFAAVFDDAAESS
jgi:hypothetical protein